ncbi:MAG: M23 family metallopeptidase [candidate division WOR-3 bacterium]
MEVILFSEKKNRVVNLVIRQGVIFLGLLLVFAIIILFIYGIFKFTAREIDQNRLDQLTRENITIAREIVRVEKKIDSFGVLIDSIKKEEQKDIKSFVMLEPLNKILAGGNDTLIPKKTDDKNVAQISRELNLISIRAERVKKDFETVLQSLKEKENLRYRIPSIAPVQGWFLAGFGYRVDPFTQSVKMHEGIDIGAPIGTPVVAPADGMVISVENRFGFGLTITIDHGYGYSTLYAHLQKANVESGEMVKRGDIIGFVGDSGKSTGPHLHYEIRISGIPVDPIDYILPGD